MLLTLLTYSYAAGAAASEDIEWACQQDPATRYIIGNACPDQDTVRAFRRAHRPWIESCVATVLERVCAVKRVEAGELVLKDSSRATRSCAPFLERARRRLELAVLMDTAMAE